MKYKDTLTLYDELITGGSSESQARVQAQQLGAMGDSLTNALHDLNGHLQAIDKDLLWMRIIGGAMIVAFLSNVFWLT